LDEVVITVRGKKHWLWRVIDADGDVLDILVQTRSGIKPIKTLTPSAEHRIYKGLNNAIEVSHRPTCKREKIFCKFKSHRQAQRFLSTHDQINPVFRPRRCQLTATSYRHARSDAFSLWKDYTAETAA
jgi:putative transposase